MKLLVVVLLLNAFAFAKHSHSHGHGHGHSHGHGKQDVYNREEDLANPIAKMVVKNAASNLAGGSAVGLVPCYKQFRDGHVVKNEGRDVAAGYTVNDRSNAQYECELKCDTIDNCLSFAICFNGAYKCYFKNKFLTGNERSINRGSDDCHTVYWTGGYCLGEERKYRFENKPGNGRCYGQTQDAHVVQIEGNDVGGHGGYAVRDAHNAQAECENRCDETQGCESFAICFHSGPYKCYLKDKVLHGHEALRNTLSNGENCHTVYKRTCSAKEAKISDIAGVIIATTSDSSSSDSSSSQTKTHHASKTRSRAQAKF